jgi:beta-lactamase regulating signal transducer with metallopeptidase domain
MAISLLLSILVNHLWQSMLVAAVLGGLTILLRRNSARVRYFLWLAASLKFLLPFVVLAALAAQTAGPLTIESPGTAATPVVMTVAAELVAPMAGVIAYPAPHSKQSEYVDMFLTFGTLALWILGALFVAARWLVRWLEIRRALRNSTVIANINFPAPVHATERQYEPGVVGIFRPKLLLPTGIEERLTPEQMRAVLAHERCHLRWRDNFTASLHMLVEAVFWFFPPVWWIGKRLIEERERDCDEQVVREGHVPERYAEGILNVCEHYIASRLPCVSGVSGADLRKRIESIVQRTLGMKLNGPRKLLLAATTCLMLAAPVAAGMISGNSLQVLFSLSPSSIALLQYWQFGDARLKDGFPHYNPDHTMNCPGPGKEFSRSQKGMAEIVARLSPADDRALFYAVVANSKADVKRLLAGGASRQGDGHLRSSSIMHIAAEFGDVEILELLANAGIPVDGFSVDGIGRGNTPLMIAITSGRLENARWLIAHGVDVNLTSKGGQSALIRAMVSCRDENLVALLLQAGAKPDFKALRTADYLGFDLRVDTTTPAPPFQSWRIPAQHTVTADFDADGIEDIAALHVSADDKSKAVFVKLSSRNTGKWVIAGVGGFPTILADIAKLELTVAKPGTFVKRCAGYPLCQKGEPAEVTPTQPGIAFRQPEGPLRIIYWDRRTRMFNNIVMAAGN